MKKLWGVFFCCYSVISGMDSGSRHNTYGGEVITPDNIQRLAEPMSVGLQEQVDSWFSQEDHVGLLTQLTTRPDPFSLETFIEKEKQDRVALESQHDVRALQGYNYSIKPDDQNFVVKATGLHCKLSCLRYDATGAPIDFEFKTFDYSMLKKEIPVYQNITRVAAALRLKESIDKNKFDYVARIPTYLYHIPSRPEVLTDENYVVVQPWKKDLISVRELPERERAMFVAGLTDPMLEELYQGAVKDTALWDAPYNLCVIKNDTKNRLVLLDYEGRYTHKPGEFYFQGKQGYKTYISCVVYGLDSFFYKLFYWNKEKRQKWNALFEQDVELFETCRQFEREKYHDRADVFFSYFPRFAQEGLERYEW